VVAVLASAACGSGSDGADAAGCDEEVAEPLDPASLAHVIAGTPEPRYLTDPPTSGAHVMAPSVAPVVDEPLPRPTQVGLLEQGGVLLQVGPALDDAEVAEVEALAGDGVTVAPLATGTGAQDDAAVIATAWRVSMRCAGVDADALAAFASSHRREGSAMAGGGS
jgi:hypothetical protein